MSFPRMGGDVSSRREHSVDKGRRMRNHRPRINDCTVVGLSCNTEFQFRVRETCMDSAADSVWEVGSAVRTPKGETCFTPATAPTWLHMKNVTASTIAVEWGRGVSNDCVFASWEVERQDGISLVYVPASGTCAGLTVRDETVCEDAGLRSNTQYRYRVREICGNGGSSSEGHGERPRSQLLITQVSRS